MKYKNYLELIEKNKQWVAERLEIDPNYFQNLAQSQHPKFLFIGCCDSRVPLTSLTGAEAGEEFIHRNIANQVIITDINMLSTLEYAIENLKVEHIIVVGHYRCGGIKAALDGVTQELVDNWVSPIRDLHHIHREELEKYDNEEEMLDRLSEINVVQQVRNIFKTPIMIRALKRKQYPLVHAWIFDIYTGFVKEIQLPIEEWKKFEFIPEDYH
jgi:carbonic anhydrase